MINAFSKSKRVAWLGGAALGCAGGAAAWCFLPAAGAGGARLLLAALAAFVGANIAVYIARLFAMREYQTRLLYLYEQLDPAAFIAAVEPLTGARLDASTRCTTLAHLANGYLYAGQPQRALQVLQSIDPPEKALEMRGLVLGNQATCYLAAGQPDKAQQCMDRLQALLADKRCKKEFCVKARHTLAYLQLCMQIQRGKKVDTKALEKDFASSRAPLHRLDVQYRLALACRRSGDAQGFESARAYVAQQGARTALPGLLQAPGQE